MEFYIFKITDKATKESREVQCQADSQEAAIKQMTQAYEYDSKVEYLRKEIVAD